MSDKKTNPLAEIEQTVLNVVRLAYVRPILDGTSVSAFQMSEDEITNLLDPFHGKIKADMDILSECLRAAYELGNSQQPPPELNDEILIEGNRNE